MFERFSSSAREAVRLAQVEAKQMSDCRVRPGHLLLGVLRQGQTRAARVLIEAGASLEGSRVVLAGEDARSLAAIGVSLEDVACLLREVVGSGDAPIPTPKGESMAFARQARRLLADADREARGAGSKRISTGHLVLACCRDDNGASVLLRQLGVDVIALAAVLEGAA